MLCEFTVGAFADAGLFSQRFSANAVLAGLTDAAFENQDWLSADHALFFLFGHIFFLSPPDRFQNLQSVEHFDLRGVLKNNLQAILRMIRDLSMNLDLSAFKTLGGCLVFFEQFRSRSKDDSGKRLPRRSKIQEISVALRRMTDAKDPAANPRGTAGKAADFFHVAGRKQRYLRRDLDSHSQGHIGDAMAFRLQGGAGCGDASVDADLLRLRCTGIPTLIEKVEKDAGGKGEHHYDRRGQ